ncbi:MAG: hypothetical protein JW829_14505 [Pirellulales bacterium]|nr:hypothetical protein [Pirellulales bacterium]
MTPVFIVCAAVGGTILVCQFVMTFIGLSGHAFTDADMPTDIGHGLGGDFHVGGDFHGGADGLYSNGGFHTDHAGVDSSDSNLAAGDSANGEQTIHHGSSWLFGVLSFRTITAALTFFGLAGLMAQSSDVSPPMVLLVAVAAGGAAMYAVYWIMQGLYKLQTEGNVRIQRSIGQRGDVYLRVPANHSGSGKIQFNLQNRTMEYLAVTSGPELPTGTKVVVVGVVSPTTLEVQAE